MQFKIAGKRTRNRFWQKVLKIAQSKVRKSEDNVIDVKSVSFPSPYCILVRYDVLNKNEKYEIVIQGDYISQYKEWRDMEEPQFGLDERQTEIIIRSNHTKAKKLEIFRK